MEEIKLLQLTLTNFKGEAGRTTKFGDGYTTIAGRNGLGKTRHFTAFLWLLTGKDQYDRKDYEVKTRENGEEVHNTITCVEGVLQVRGQRVTLKRAIEENWVKPKGQTTSVFKGNSTECWYDGVPCSVRDYEKRVEALIGDPTLFKLLSNPDFFASLEWKKQREQLMALAGDISDYEVATTAEGDFTALLDILGNKSIDDHKAVVASRKRQIKDELEKVQPRIEQAYRMTPNPDDWKAIEAEIKAVNAELATLTAEQTTADENYRIAAERARERQTLENNRALAIRNAQLQAQQEAFEADAAARAEYTKRETERRAIEDEITGAQVEQSRLKRTKTANEGRVIDINASMTRHEERRDALRAEWATTNDLFFDTTAAVCAYCGQLLPDEKIAAQKARFESHKENELARILADGKKCNQDIDACTKELADTEANIKQIEADLLAQQTLEMSLRNKLNALPSITFTPTQPKQVDPATLAEVQQIDAKIAEIDASMHSTPNDVRSALQARSSALTEQLTQLTQRLAVREQIKNCDAEVQRLKDEGRTLAQALANVEAEEFMIAEFIKAKCETVEKRVNAMFKNVQFKLFDKTLDGNIFETCRILVNGVIYQSANTASQMNAGLDILRVLTKYYGKAMPVFIDGAERANHLDLPPTQCILLRVTDDAVLQVRPDSEY